MTIIELGKEQSLSLWAQCTQMRTWEMRTLKPRWMRWRNQIVFRLDGGELWMPLSLFSKHFIMIMRFSTRWIEPRSKVHRGQGQLESRIQWTKFHSPQSFCLCLLRLRFLPRLWLVTNRPSYHFWKVSSLSLSLSLSLSFSFSLSLLSYRSHRES